MNPLHNKAQFFASPLRLNTLVKLRWLAILGQSVSVLFVAFVLEFPLPLGFCFSVIAVSVWFNILLRIRFSASYIPKAFWTASMLSYDILQLATLLYFTGGLQNPFAPLLIVPVVIAATTLKQIYILGTGTIAFLCAGLLAVFHWPLPWDSDQEINLPLDYIIGTWIAIGILCSFLVLIVMRISKENRRMNEALNTTEMILANEQKLTALDGFAAAAAHELGTPLSTISTISAELLRADGKMEDHVEDLSHLKQQSDRCKQILANLTSLDLDGVAELEKVDLEHLIDELIEPYNGFETSFELNIDESLSHPNKVLISRNPAIIYGLGNLVENAVDYAEDTVSINVSLKKETISIEIADDGPGFSADILDRIGEPFVSSRLKNQTDSSDIINEFGLGLGFFIAKVLLERSGARVNWANKKPGKTGAILTVSWPLNALQ